MLKFMRKYARSYLIKIIFAVIIVVFVFYFGAGSLREKETKIAEVGSFDILYPEYYEAYNKELEMFRQLYRDKFDEKMAAELKDKVLQDLVNKYVLLVEAKKLGITVSDQEFADLLGSIEAFKKDGKFDNDRYVSVLRQNKIEPEQFERSEKTTLLIRKVVSIVRDTGAPVTDADIWAGYVREKGKVDLNYSRFSPSAYKDKITVTEKELNDVYDKEKDRFRGENTYRLKYIVVDAKSAVKDDQVYMDLLKAKDIDAYAREKGLKVNDTGTVRQSELFKAYKSLKIETWAKDLRKGDVSLPIRDDGRSLIFQLIEREDGKPMEKSAALQNIKNRLAAEKAKEKARLAAEDAVKNKSVDKKTNTGFISRTATSLPKIGDVPRDNTGMLGLTKDKPIHDKPVEINGDYYVFGYAGEQEPDRQAWQKDKDRFSQYYTVRNKEQFLTSFIEESKQAMLKQGKIKIVKNPKEI
jgi:peptidyl-prolyl cis-trans isomerase D